METLIKLDDYPDDVRYWTGDRIYPYLGDCKIVMSISIRNIGKTYSAFKQLRSHIDNGFNVAISRYDRVELGVSINDFLRYYDERGEDGQIIHHYKKIKPPVDEMPIKIYEFESGARVYFFAIKDSPNLKGLEIPNLSRWFIDEFVPIFYKYQTRKYNEFEYFGELYHTIQRGNESRLKVIMSANCKVWENPYFMGWEIPKFSNGHIMKIERTTNIGGKVRKMKIAIENVKPSKAMMDAFVEGESLLGKSQELIQHELTDYSCDPDAFIETSKNAQDLGIQIKIKGNIYGLYNKNGKTFVSEERLNLNKDRYLLTPLEYDENFVFTSSFTKTVENLLNFNRLRFDKRKTEFNVRLGIFLSHTRKV